MRLILIALLILHFTAYSAVAQEDEAPSLMERGALQFLEGLLLEMDPAFDSMRGFVEEMGPALAELMGQIEDWSVYETPEILENGDIIIRRKPDATPPKDEPPQIDL